MQDNISCALITAFERQYDTSWDDPNLRNERLAMRYGWTAAMEAKQCLHHIQDPAPVQAAHPTEVITGLWEAIGHHSAQVAETGEMAPGQKLLDAARAVDLAIRPPAIASLPNSDYLEGVSIPNLREALIFLGRENGVGEGEVGDKLAQYVNSVVSGVLSKKASLREASKAAPAAVAVPDERAAFEKWIAKDGGDLSTFGSGQNTHYCNSAVNNAWTGWQARAALAATPAAAPVVLPEPAAAVGELMRLVEMASIQRASTAVLIYTEQPKELSDKSSAQEQETVRSIEAKLRALLAGVSAPAAVADTPDSFREWFAKNYPADTIILDPDWHAKSIFRMAQAHARLSAPQAQADAREAQLLAFAVSEIRRDEMTDSELLDAMERQRIAVVPEYEGPWDAEIYNDEGKPNHRGSGSTPREAIRAAIAAAKGE